MVRSRAAIVTALAIAGCASARVAPAPAVRCSVPVTTAPTPISVEAARAELDALARQPKVKLDRPLVICGGFLDVGVGPWLMKRTIARYVDGPIVTASFLTMWSMRGSREWLAERIATTVGEQEVDVIGQSLGGLIAMHAAIDDPGLGPRARIRRLYTDCSPLQGAKLATITPFDVLPYQRDLRPRSALGKRLAATPIAYDVISYARTRRHGRRAVRVAAGPAADRRRYARRRGCARRRGLRPADPARRRATPAMRGAGRAHGATVTRHGRRDPTYDAAMHRQPEPELMDLQHEVDAYASADFREVNARFVDRVLAVAPQTTTDACRVIDLGCGPGEITIAIARARPTWDVLGVDGSSPMLQIAAKRAARDLIRNVRFRLTDVRRLAAEFGPFDLIVSNSLLHHLREPNELWDAVRRVAAPGATVLVRDLFRPASDAEALAIVESYADAESETLKEEFHRSLRAAWTVDEVRDHLNRLGLGESFTVEAISDRHLDVRGVVLP